MGEVSTAHLRCTKCMWDRCVMGKQVGASWAAYVLVCVKMTWLKQQSSVIRRHSNSCGSDSTLFLGKAGVHD